MIKVKYKEDKLEVLYGNKVIESLDWSGAVNLYLNVKHEVEKKLFLYAKDLLDEKKDLGGPIEK